MVLVTDLCLEHIQLLEEFTVSSLISLAHIGLIIRNLVYSTLSPGNSVSTVLALGTHFASGKFGIMDWMSVDTDKME